MTEAAPKRRLRWRAIAAGGTLVGASALVALGPGAPLMVDALADGVRVWRLGHLQVDGVSGAWIGDLRAERATIADADGVWLEARDVALDWLPQSLAFGRVHIRTATAESIAVARRPVLLDSRSARGGVDVSIDALHVASLSLAEPVVGATADFTADLTLDVRDKTLRAISANLRRLDSDADRLSVTYDSGGAFTLSVELESAPGGTIARLAGVEEFGLRATAASTGDAAEGATRFEAFAGTQQLLGGQSQWADGLWTAEARAQLDGLPVLATLSRRIGSSLALNVSGQQRAFDLHAETPFVELNLQGARDEEGQLDGPARFTATTTRLSEIARESPFELGAARLEGELRRARGTTAIQATAYAEGIEAFGRRTQFTGPLEAALTPDRFTLSADLRAPQEVAPLFANARLQTQFEYDRLRRRFELTRAELDGDALAASAQGWTVRGDGEFSGAWRVRRMETLIDATSGDAAGRWRALRDDGEQNAWSISIDGQADRLTSRVDVIPQLLGAQPQLDARLRYADGVINVLHARIDGARLRAGASGQIVRGEANLALEASARGPLSVGGAEITGAVDATGRITGRLARPTLSIRAAFPSFAGGGVVVEQPVLGLTLAPRGGTYAGRATLVGAANGQPLEASSDLDIETSALQLSNLDAQWGAMQAQGAARFASTGVSAELDVNGALDGLAPGVTGRVAGHLELAPEVLTLTAEIADARAGELRVRAATVRAEGPPQAIAATFDLRGRLGQAPLSFAGVATVDSVDHSATIEGRGTLADAAIFTRAPMTASWGDGRVRSALNVAVGNGVVRGTWEERGRALSGSADIEDAPLGPLAVIFGERATGQIDGRITFAGNQQGLSGTTDVTISGARVTGRQRDALDMRIVGNLTPRQLTAEIDATSPDGLVARFEADAPVETSAAPVRIALARERRGRASWSVRGPAEALWAAARLPDQSLQGALSGEGALSFGAGYLSGEGHIQIANGRFEDKLTGVTLTELNARLALSERGVAIENFAAAGPRGGRLTATGGSVSEREGAISVRLDRMRVADRPDARALASGELTLAWEGQHSSLSGNLDILEASIDLASNPQAGIPTIEVIEVNRPGEEGPPEEPRPARRNGSTTLDISVSAPTRIVTRGRGLDAEWSLDLRLRGTASNPQVFGIARAVRGTMALSGQPFEIEDAVIEFTGDPLDARINLTAVRDTADLSARIRMTGTARDPEIAFKSDPPLPEDEILPQVLFGRSVEDLSAFEAAQLAASLAALSGRASLDIVDAARAAAGLDRFNVRQDEDGGFLVAGGVYLTRNVYVEVARTGLGQAQTRVEWTVRPRLVLVTSFLGNGDQRVSLRWRRESD